MEVDHNASGVQEPNISDVTGQSTNKNSVAYDTHKKLLGEKKKMQSQFTEMQDKLKSFEDRELETNGQKDELIASLRGRLEESESKYGNAEKAFAWRQINSAIEKEALSQGCSRPDKLVRLLDDADINSIELDQGYMVNNKDVEAIIGKAKEDNAFLFSQKKINVVDQTPVNGINNKTKSMSEMTPAEVKEQIRLLDSQGE